MLVREADFVREYEALRAIRFAVFVDEQAVPEEIEMDERDAKCRHVVALDSPGQPVGTGRIDLEQGGKIGRLAVLAAYRRTGVGTQLMEALHEIAIDCGLRSVWCNAQVLAAPFYESLGYRITSEAPFDEAGIMHVRMETQITSG